jgi:glycosyltransferase involved in cell wall biosynthesis
VSDAPIRIAFCITDLDPGGAERNLVQLVTRLDRSEWEPRVYCLGGLGALVRDLADAEVPVECFGARSARSIAVVVSLVRRLRAFRPQLLQSFLFHANLAGRVAGRVARVPIIVSGVRVAEHEQRWHLRLDRWTNGLVTHNVCVSQGAAEFSIHAAGLRREKVSVIPNGVNFVQFAYAEPINLETFGIPRGARTVLSVGRLEYQKGHLILLEAIEPLLDRYPRVHVLIVGDGPLREDLLKWIASYGRPDRIHLAGWQPDVPGLMRAGSVFVLPSLWEGMPNVVLEAMAAGLPVIAADVEGVREVIAHGQTGLIVNPSATWDLESKLVTMLDSPHEASRMAIAAQNTIREAFTVDRVVAAYTALYRSLLAGGGIVNA